MVEIRFFLFQVILFLEWTYFFFSFFFMQFLFVGKELGLFQGQIQKFIFFFLVSLFNRQEVVFFLDCREFILLQASFKVQIEEVLRFQIILECAFCEDRDFVFFFTFVFFGFRIRFVIQSVFSNYQLNKLFIVVGLFKFFNIFYYILIFRFLDLVLVF